ncbi:DUF1501 domain-containing protein [Planctomicrobium sp. SH664]|uniref:DUF1501 domain-containing protein n=1 Tax=Planctomicrobium sp. SH664 TaxID=3448125 RepID=UPI003F5C32BE
MPAYVQENVLLQRHQISRRRFLRQISVASAATGLLNFRDALSLQASELRRQGKSLILLWMAGGPSQFETFDPKPAHENGGETHAISTAVPGIQIAEGWEKTAQLMNEIAIIRSLTNKEGNHQRATYQMHTGYIPSGSVKHPAFGSLVAQQLADPEAELPSVVSIGRTQGSGFLGVDYEPFIVDQPGKVPANLGNPQTTARFERRLGLLQRLEGEFAQRGADANVTSHRQLYQKAARLVLSPQTSVFDLEQEPADLRAEYGDTEFGRGCLLARRLVETGTTCVEVRSNGWDTHDDLENRISQLAGEVDPACAALLADLKSRGLLERTVVVWAGEFGRTPKLNARGGRDHYPRVFNCWIAGGGVRGGQVIGKSTADGTAVDDRPVTVADFLKSLSHALGINPLKENISPLGRPMKVVDGGEVIQELFA